MVVVGISDMIARFINEVLEGENGCCELQRSELANRFGCVPSQINYVISTRFSPEHGYQVESRRGGNGYIRIRKIKLDARCLMMHTINVIGDSVDLRTARALLSNLLDTEALDQGTAKLLLAAMGEGALGTLPREQQNRVRAEIFKQMLIQLLSEQTYSKHQR